MVLRTFPRQFYQAQFNLSTAHAFFNIPTPPAPAFDFPALMTSQARNHDFIAILDFLCTSPSRRPSAVRDSAFVSIDRIACPSRGRIEGRPRDTRWRSMVRVRDGHADIGCAGGQDLQHHPVLSLSQLKPTICNETSAPRKWSVRQFAREAWYGGYVLRLDQAVESSMLRNSNLPPAKFFLVYDSCTRSQTVFLRQPDTSSLSIAKPHHGSPIRQGRLTDDLC